ncbi:MAG: hypothetical protein Q4D29_13235, partial [Lachnospiraceae bacterium]|nr:hypothetical protein [Lachnospiraceae bacterium]
SMANAFFMEYMVIVCIVAYKYSGTAKKQDLIIIAVLLTGLSIMRIEGALYVGVIILCIMMLKYNNLDIVKYFVCPMTVLQILYLLRIFAFMTLHTFAQFMTKEKAIILIAFLAMIIIYNLVVRDRLFAKYKKYYPVVITLGLLVINVLALIYKTDRYIANLKAFSANLLRNSGWGLFVPFVIGVLILVPKKSIKVSYFDYVAICYVLLAVIAGWARGDALVENFGDSGNRIMIQAVPIILFALMVKVIEGLEYWEKESLN